MFVACVQGAYLRSQLTRSVNAETRLANELKRTQESLLFLSAWDEEKIELEAEVRHGGKTRSVRITVCMLADTLKAGRSSECKTMACC